MPRVHLTIFLALVAACGSHSPSTAADGSTRLPDQCESFLASYERSLSALGPARIAHSRALQTRASLEAKILAHPNTEQRESLAQLCTDQMRTWNAGEK